MIGVVMFDIGNVLMGRDPQGCYDRRIARGRRAMRYRGEGWTTGLLEGVLTEAEVA